MAELHEYQSSSEEHLVAPQQTGVRAWRQRAQGAGAATLVLLLVGTALHGSSYQTTVAVEETESLAEINAHQANWQVVAPERDHCTAAKKDCSESKCCKITGQRCISSGGAKPTCALTCTKGKSCTVLSETMTFDTHHRTSLFCYSVYTENTGSTKKSEELDLLKYVAGMNASIFACDSTAVYGDVAVDAPPLTVMKVDDVENEFHFAKRKHMGTWINTGMYKQVWKAIAKAGTYAKYDWTVKADADAVFLPKKLIARIELAPIPPSGGFMVNCEKVKYGFFGNLEVTDKTAFSILAANIDSCSTDTVSNWKVGIDHGKYGPMGEDLFAEICMRKNGVTAMEMFDITKDGCCEAKRPGNEKKNKKWKPDCATTDTPAMHPFKKLKDYKACLAAVPP